MADGNADITDKEQKSLDVLHRLGSATIREWADAEETDEYGSPRGGSDDAQRARAERLEAKGQVTQYVSRDGRAVYKPAA